jgi:predicted dehydrogenase
MDLETQSTAFRARKVLRYLRLYGLSRTWCKVQGKRHMARRFDPLPDESEKAGHAGHVGMLGCGNFAYSTLAYYLQRNFGRHVIRAAMDIDPHHAASLARDYRAAYYTTDAERVIEDPAIDLVVVASNHASHTDYAIRALDRGKSVHIEKPHIVDDQQLESLVEAMRRNSGRVNLGFNRPFSRIGTEVQRLLHSQSGPSMMSWFVVGHELADDHWYLNDGEGGRVMGNLCHWTDFVYHMVPEESRYPIEIRPTVADRTDCDIAVTLTFADGTIACIAFSEKGHTFEGVREHYTAHRGDVFVTLLDFQHCVADVLDRRHRIGGFFRDHGHEETVRTSYGLVRPVGGVENPGRSARYIWETGELALRVKQALEENRTLVVERRELD